MECDEHGTEEKNTCCDSEELLHGEEAKKTAGNNQWTNNNLKYYPMKEIVRTVPAEIEKKERLSLLYRKIQSFSYHVRTSCKGKKKSSLTIKEGCLDYLWLIHGE